MSEENNKNDNVNIDKQKSEPALNEGIAFKAERLFAKNWFIIAFLSIILCFYGLYTIEKATKEIANLFLNKKEKVD